MVSFNILKSLFKWINATALCISGSVNENTIIIFGSSSSNGNTFDAMELIINKIHDASFINLENYKISDYVSYQL